MPGAHLISPRGDVERERRAAVLQAARAWASSTWTISRGPRASSAASCRSTIASGRASVGAALGYSNGANILASVLFARAAADRPRGADASADPVRAAAAAGSRRSARADHGRPARSDRAGRRHRGLAAYFEAQGADVETAWHEGGHEVRPDEIDAARRSSPESDRAPPGEGERPILSCLPGEGEGQAWFARKSRSDHRREPRQRAGSQAGRG